MNGQFRQRFAVQLDSGFIQSGDKSAVGHTVLTAGGVNANNPHVNGNGMDIDGNGPKGKKVLAWLEAHSTNGNIDGTNLRYAAIKSTSGEITIQISGK